MPDHGKIHIRVVTDRNIVFPAPVIQIGFGESPVAAPADKPAAVDVETQDPVIFVEGYLPHPRLEGLFIGNAASVDFKSQFDLIQVGIAIAVGPPQYRVFQVQRRVGGGIEGYYF